MNNRLSYHCFIVPICMVLLFPPFSLYSQSISATDTVDCDTVITTFSVTSSIPTDTYAWDFGNDETSTESNPTVTYTEPGLYTVRVNYNGTTITETDFIHVLESPNARYRVIESSPDAIGTYQYIFLAPDTTVRIFEWRNNNTLIHDGPRFFYTFPGEGDYRVSLFVDDGECSSLVSRIIAVRDSFLVPNVLAPLPASITPNGSAYEKYSQFIVKTNGLDPVSIKIFTRSGALVYKAEAPLIIWDGKNSSGHDLSPGVYYYVIEYNTEVKQTKTGFVYLFR